VWSAYACIEGGNIEDVSDRAAIGIISEPNAAGGLPVADIEAPEIEGETEYCRPSLPREGTAICVDSIP
jgi:hypothetical protein